MTIVVQRPSDEAQLQSFLLGLEVLWPFQVATFAGDATGGRGDRNVEHEAATHEAIDGLHF